MNKCDIQKCDIYGAINIIKSRYNSVIIRSLENENKSFTQLKEEFSYLTSTQLTRSLNELKKNKIIVSYNLYQLTAIGEELIPIFNELEKWYYKNY